MSGFAMVNPVLEGLMAVDGIVLQMQHGIVPTFPHYDLRPLERYD